MTTGNRIYYGIEFNLNNRKSGWILDSFELTVQGIAVLIVGATEAVPLRRHAAIRIEVGVTALDADT